MKEQAPSTVILGAGIAGLSTAYFLQQQGIPALVLEKATTYGGLARSFRWHNFWCDFSAHRFFTRDIQVLKTVQSLVPLHRHERRSQIYLANKWMRDPLDAIELATRLRPADTFHLIADYATRDRNRPEASFADYVVRRYGDYFHDLCLRPYTERLFDLPAEEIAVEWARRKVRFASPRERLNDVIKPKLPFYYPVHGGYGAISDTFYAAVKDQVTLEAKVTGFEWDQAGKITAVSYVQAGEQKQIAVDVVVSTLPLTLTAGFCGVDVRLTYQKVDCVYLWLSKPFMTNNHWLYFMNSASVINRIVEFKHMSPNDTDPDTTVICAEVTREVADPIAAVIDNLVQCGLIQRGNVMDTLVIHEQFAYPRYSRGYPAVLRDVEQQLQQHSNLYSVGRAAQFDHFEVDDIISVAHAFATQHAPTRQLPNAVQS